MQIYNQLEANYTRWATNHTNYALIRLINMLLMSLWLGALNRFGANNQLIMSRAASQSRQDATTILEIPKASQVGWKEKMPDPEVKGAAITA
jgi:hypothetical protein